MNKINMKTVIFWTVKLIVFLIFLGVIWKIFSFLKPYLLNNIAKLINGKLTIAKDVISFFLGILDVVISAFITSAIGSIYTAKQDPPRIFITSSNLNALNVSGTKTRFIGPRHLCVKIKNEQPKFRVVYAIIRNTGNRIISECSINKQVISINLDPNQSSNLYFIIYESANDMLTNEKYKFLVCIRDDQGDVYTGKCYMKVDYNKFIATFHFYKKMKRSILKNALPNL